jgi:hypothetical protein
MLVAGDAESRLEKSRDFAGAVLNDRAGTAELDGKATIFL